MLKLRPPFFRNPMDLPGMRSTGYLFPESMKLLLLLILIPAALFAQNILELKQKIDAGESEIVKSQLPTLMAQYPKNPELLFLSGLVETDGEKALLIYRDVLSHYPNSSVADDAFLKIIEYLFTKGLYAKTEKYAREFIRTYPKSNLIDKAVYLKLCSLNAQNKRDSVDYYYQYYSERYPDLDFHFANYRSASNLVLSETDTRSQANTNPAKAPQSGPNTPSDQSEADRYTLQMGVFGNPANARALRLKLEKLGYSVTLKKIERSGRILTVVTTGSFITESEAQLAGNKLKKEKNFDFVIVKK